MKLDITKFPLVDLDYASLSDEPVDELLSQIRGLLDKQEPFVFIGRGFPEEDSQSKESVEERRKVSLWMKANKSDILRFIKANIQIVPDVAQQANAEAFSVIFERFWGYPMFVVTTEQQAQRKANTLLGR